MQTILGSGGSIGKELAKSLSDYTKNIRLVSRNPEKVNDTDEILAADLTRKDKVDEAVAGSQICYLTIGLDYNIKTWRKIWPDLIRNVTDSCKRHQCKLVFFDNVYAIGGDGVRHITENSEINPSSQKGEVRAEVNRILLDQMEKGDLEVIIARSPDFFGTVIETSVLMNLVYNNLSKGKAAQWFCNADVPHTIGYTPELAKGTAILGNNPDAFNQVWNLPVHPEDLTGQQWAELFAEEMNRSSKVKVIPGWVVKTMGLFVPIMKELAEMNYQFDRPYHFDSSKFRSHFQYTPVSNKEAVKQTLEKLR